MMHDDVTLSWRTPVEDRELVELTAAHGGTPEAGWWDRGDHAFLIDTKTHPSHQHQGLGTAVVRHAVAETRAAGCEWLFVDYSADMAPFYEDACGFAPTRAGLVHLR
jgi:GNAT superfamily N-acetyltransferase